MEEIAALDVTAEPPWRKIKDEGESSFGPLPAMLSLQCSPYIQQWRSIWVRGGRPDLVEVSRDLHRAFYTYPWQNRHESNAQHGIEDLDKFQSMTGDDGKFYSHLDEYVKGLRYNFA